MDQLETDYLSRLQNLLKDAVQSTCTGLTSYALIDFPDHSNVGDSAIYLGEMVLLRDIFGCEPRFVSKAKNHVDDIEHFQPVDVVFLHGGGNFGDVWPAHQLFRERIVARYPDTKIVQLPQTLFYKDPAALARSVSIINRHPDFTLLLRDARSYEMATKAFDCTVALSPDSAMALGALSKLGRVTLPKLAMLRQDHEAQLTAGDIGAKLENFPIDDWIEEPRFKSTQANLLDKIMPRLGLLRRQGMPALSKYYEDWASIRVERGLRQLSSADFIITDRLHVHILSSLLGIEHVVLDNNYGKISEYIKHWGMPNNARIISSISEL